MKTLSAFNQTAIDKATYKVIRLAKLEFDGLTLYLCDKMFSSQNTWQGNVYEPLILGWDVLKMGEFDPMTLVFDHSEISVLINNSVSIAGFECFTSIFNSYYPSFAQITVSEIHEGASVAGDEDTIFIGDLEDFSDMKQESLGINFVGKELSLLSKFSRNVIDEETYPGADPDEFGKILPICYGYGKRVPFRAVDAGTMDNLQTDITPTDGIIEVSDASGFPPSGGTIQIDLEQITYSYITGNSFGGCSRGQNSTEAVEHDAGAIVAEIQSEYFYILEHAVKAIDNVYVVNRNNDDNIRQTTGFTTYTGQTGNEHASYPGKAVIRFNTRPSILAQVNITPVDTIDVDDLITVNDPEHRHGSGYDIKIWEFESAQYTAGGGGVFEDKLGQICDGSLGVQDNYDSAVNSCGWLQNQSTTVELQKAFYEIPSGEPIQYRVKMAIAFLDANVNVTATFKSSTTGAQSSTGISSGGWYSYSGDWDAFNNEIAEVVRGGTSGAGYAGVSAVWVEVRYYVSPTESSGVTKNDTVYKTGTVTLIGNSVADTVIGGEVSADVQGFEADDSGNYGTEGDLIERPDYILKHFLVNYCGLSVTDNIGATYATAGSNYASENITLSVVLDSIPDISNLIANMAMQAKSVHWWENGKHNLKYIPFIESSAKTIEAHRIQLESINLYYTSRTDVRNEHIGLYYREWIGPYKETEEFYREVTKAASVTSQGIFGVLEADPHKFDFIINQSQAERVLSWISDSRSYPRLVVEFSGWHYLSDIQFGDVIDFTFDADSELDRAFLKLVISDSTVFRVVGIYRDQLGKIHIKAVTVASETTDSNCFDASEDGYSQGANFYDSTLAIPLGDYNGSPVT